jgi:hypothetical protein
MIIDMSIMDKITINTISCGGIRVLQGLSFPQLGSRVRPFMAPSHPAD